MMTVNQVSRLTGVSIRTLQYYDRIGLMKATAYTEARYRLYDDRALERLQQILLFRELEFPLKDIHAILDSPNFDRHKALEQQIKLLELKREHIEGLITLARGIQENGGKPMNFSAFNKKKQESYVRQAKESWGKTDSWQEFEGKHKGRTPETEAALGQGLMEIFARMGQLRASSPESPDAQSLVAQLRDYITRNYYVCTNPILLSLGRMYAADEAFTRNIDAAGGKGTARFACQAIQAFCVK